MVRNEGPDDKLERLLRESAAIQQASDYLVAEVAKLRAEIERGRLLPTERRKKPRSKGK